MRNGFLRENLPFFLLLVFISFSLLFLDRTGRIRSIRGFAERPILAIEERIYNLKLLSFRFFKPLSFGQKKEEELMRLEGQVRQLSAASSQLSTCLEENEAMRRLLGAPLPPSWKFLPAKVVGVSEKMRIDKGAKAGVQEGSMVVYENILVGKVIRVGEYDSLVQLPTDPTSKIPSLVRKPGEKGIRARGLLIGQLGGLLLDRVLQEEDLGRGDQVLTGGEEGWLPDLVIGQIEEVLPGTAALYQKAKVTPLVDYGNLRTVFVVTP